MWRVLFILAITPLQRGGSQGIAPSNAIEVTGSSSSMSVVTVPMPASFPPGTRVRYTVTPLIESAVFGQLSGEMLTTGGSAPTILFAVRVPRHIAAGRLEIARVRYSASTVTIVIPVVAIVETTRHIAVSGGDQLAVGHAGSPLALGYRLSNLGNAADTVIVEAILPVGWRSTKPDEPQMLAARETVDRSLVVVPPPNATGTTTVRLVVQSRGAVVAESMVDVQVAGPGGSAFVSNGPLLTLGVATAGGPWDGFRTLESIELRGPLADGLSVGARASTSSNNDAAYAFSRANVAPTPFSFQLSSAEWRVDAGVLGASLSNLTGVNLVGRGTSVLVRQPAWKVAAVAATPDVGARDTRGSLAGARLELAPMRNVAVSTSIARLRETRGASSRELDAIALGGGLSGFLGGELGAELGRRRFDETTASGWAAEYTKRAPDENIDIRYVHAPGGSHAFARAASELAASGSRKLSPRLNVTGSLWRTADDGAASLSRMLMDGWTIGGHYTLREDIHFSLAARSSALSATTSLGEFGSGERGGDASLDVRRGSLSTRLTVTAASLLRNTSPADAGGAVHRQAASRAAVRGSIGSAFNGASLVVTGQYERTGAGVGAAPEQWSYGAQLSATPDLGLGDALRLEASAERTGGALGYRALTLHAGAELTVFRRSVIHASVERNPWILPTEGASPWMYVVGVSRSVNLPSLSNRGTRGRVFKDLNGNGRADDGEPGFAGVVLRRRGAMAVSGRSGAFSLDGDPREPYEVDARSLPLGWLASASTVPGDTREIGAIAVSPLRVYLALDDSDTTRIPRTALAQVIVKARDEGGREWMSQRTSDSTLVFDALPPGRYTITTDASASGEPLRAVGDPAPIVVSSGRATPPVRIVMRARQLRFSNQRRSGE